MSTETTVDIEALNMAAIIVYQQGEADGRQIATQEVTRRLSTDHAASLIDLAMIGLRLAMNIDTEDDDSELGRVRRAIVLNVVSTLGRTPDATRVDAALAVLRDRGNRTPGKELDRASIAAALGALEGRLKLEPELVYWRNR